MRIQQPGKTSSKPKFNIAGIGGACCAEPGVSPRCVQVYPPDTCSPPFRFFPGEECGPDTCDRLPCCYQDGRPCDMQLPLTCQNLEGTPFGELDLTCADIECPEHRPCCDRAYNCAMTTEEDCLSQFGEWHRDALTCNDITCGEIIRGACCLPGGQCAVVTEGECISAGGVYHPNVLCFNANCPPPPLPTGCLSIPSADPLLPPDGLEWSLSLCNNIFLEPAVFYEGEIDRGFMRMQSLNRVRAVGMEYGEQSLFIREPCGYHWGDYGLDEVGFLTGYFCSEPVFGDRDHRQESRTQTVLQQGTDPENLIEPGFVAEVGAYHTPYWTEAKFDSHKARCVRPV